MIQVASTLLLCFLFLGEALSLHSANTIPQTITIEELLILEQGDHLTAIGVRSNPNPGLLPIRVFSNFVPVVFQNNTGLPASQVYLTFHGTSATNPNGVQFIQFNTATAQGSFVAGASNLLSSKYSVQLSSMPQVHGFPGSYLFYVPLTNSGRAYVSIGQPMFLPVTTTSPFSVTDPTGTIYTEASYYTLYDFYEFTFNQSGQSGVNLAWQANFNTSAVDFFGISSELQFLSYPTGQLLQTFDPTQVNDGPTTFNISRQSVLTSLNTAFTTANNSTYWSRLLLPLLSNPYNGASAASTYLRVLNPGYSILFPPASYGGGVPFPQNPSAGFPKDYLQNAAAYGQNYVNQWLGNYTGPTTLNLTLDVLSSPYPLYNGVTTGSSMSYTLTLTSSNGALTETLTQANLTAGSPPNSTAFFTGTGFPFTPTGGYVAQISEYFGATFEVGLWGLSNISQSNLRANSASYYTNPSFVTGGPWYDLYAKTLHQQALIRCYAQVQNFGAVYASPYDDLLGINSSIANKNPTDFTTTPNPYINVTLNPIGTVPSIADTGSYQVTFTLNVGGSSLSYRTGGSGSYTPYTVPIPVNSFPLQVAYVSGNSPAVTRYYTIYLKYQNMQPTAIAGNQFNTVDQGIFTSTTIYPNSATPTAFTVTFNQ